MQQATQRIVITGGSGSGKTTLARALQERTGASAWSRKLARYGGLAPSAAPGRRQGAPSP